MDAATCANFSYEKYIDIEIENGDGSTMVKPEIGTVMKFSLDTFKEETLSQPENPSSFETPCSCDNIVLETHYKIYFSEVEPVAEPEVDSTTNAGRRL